MTDKCCICGGNLLDDESRARYVEQGVSEESLKDWLGNNARPVANGRCCNPCNDEHVIPARINRLHAGLPMQALEDELGHYLRVRRELN